MLCSLILLLFINALATINSKTAMAFGDNQSCQVSLNKEVSSCSQDLLHPFQNSGYHEKEILELQESSLKKVESLLENKEFQALVANLQEKVPALQSALPRKGQDQGELLIFVSFSMGEKALLNIAQEAKRYGATLVLRGFHKNSYQKTVHALQKIISKTGQGFIIDPELYALFAIEAIPTFILVKPFQINAVERTQTPLHDRLQGHVCPHYALEKFAKEGDLKETAQALLERGKKP